MKILVVDDERIIIELLEDMLPSHKVVSATDGREAIEKYRELKPDMVLMDIRMPVMDGIESIKEILKMDPNAKILAVTAYAHIMHEKIMEAGALEIIEKPFSRQLLDNKINKYTLG